MAKRSKEDAQVEPRRITTPFEIELVAQLDIERLRFSNEWLFPWHQINMPDRSVNVEDFKGGRITFGNTAFEGQAREIYWLAIGRYLTQEIHSVFRKWDTATINYPAIRRFSALDGAEGLLLSFITQTIERAVDTDKRLRGRGFPRDVVLYNASREHSHANAQTYRLAQSHRMLGVESVPAPKRSALQLIETLGTKYRGTIAIIALLVAFFFGIWKLLGA
ncbi:MAG: hypothetical protein Q8R02_22045 [Hyphomonadaceae bacterium]|nr:hypothetical protein [Hyphomonadaceae bacterium]